MSFFLPGLGQLYLGRGWRALALFALLWAVPFVFTNLFPITTHAWVYYSYMAVLVGMVLFITLDAVLIAMRSRLMEPKAYNTWYVYIGFAVLTLIINTTVFYNKDFLFGYGNFHIPGHSMDPTLQPGDFIVSDERAYLHTSPKHGEVIVFLFPPHKQNVYIKRVIGIPGDTVYIKNGETYINGHIMAHPVISPTMRTSSYSREFGPISVPAGNYFVLGDDRDESNDSRFWGFVPAANVLGRVTYIWYSRDSSRIGKVIE